MRRLGRARPASTGRHYVTKSRRNSELKSNEGGSRLPRGQQSSDQDGKQGGDPSESSRTPGQRSTRPRPGRRPQRDSQGPSRSRTGRAGHTPSAPQHPRGGRGGVQQRTSEGADGRLRVIPLGGIGEIGKSMMAVEYGDDMVIIDAGGKFPEEWERGIDLIIPDIRYVKNRLSKLREARLDEKVELHAMEPRERVRLGDLELEFINVTHTIPASYAIAVHSPAGTIIDTGDFKFDPTPVMGAPTDEARLRELGDQGVLALFSDTTRVETPGHTPSERVVMETLDRVIRDAKGQTLVATFASNISRVYMVLKAAEKYGKKVAVAGRSMEQNVRTALQLGYLDPPEGVLLPLDAVLRLPPEQRVLVVTGSQGEASAALARIAADEHQKIHIGARDVVMISATPVPGNEETVSETIDNLFRRGANVVFSSTEGRVHVSGHAARDELKKMLELVRPVHAVPIHGEYRHMALYRDLAASVGVSVD